MQDLSLDELQFFDGHAPAFPLYLCLRQALLDRAVPFEIRTHKTQISFYCRYLFAAASFLPVRKRGERPDPFLTISFGLPERLCSSRIDAAVEAYSGRWTHHVTIGSAEEIDAQLLAWLLQAAAFALSK